MTMLRGNFGDLLAPGFREIFFGEFGFGSVPEQWPMLFNKLTSERQYEDDSYVAGFGTIPTKTEGAAVTFDNPVQGFDKRYTHSTYALAYRITEEMIEDELYNIIRQFPAELGRSMAETRNINGAGIYNDGFDSSVRTGGDGLELFSTLHVLAGSGTQKNELTTAANLNADSLEQAIIDMKATTDDRGKLMILHPTKLVVPPELEWEAQKLLGSSQDPDSANNAINPASRLKLQLVVNDYLTDTNAWFLLADRHFVNWFDRVMPQHEGGNDFDTGDAKFKVRARWSNGWSLPWGVFGSPGA